MGYSWQVALGANFISGCIFTLLALLGMAGKLVDIVPESLKQAIAAGIGLLIGLIGLEYAGIVVATPGVLVGLGRLGSRPVLVSLFGLAVIAILLTRRIPGALLWGFYRSALLGLVLGVVKFHGLFSAPPSLSPNIFEAGYQRGSKGGD